MLSRENKARRSREMTLTQVQILTFVEQRNMTELIETICTDCASEEGCDKKASKRTSCEDYQEIPPWLNKFCNKCPNDYYANCPYDGHPQAHCKDLLGEQDA